MKLSTLKTSLIGAAALASAFFTGTANASTTFELTGDAAMNSFGATSFTASLSFDDEVADDSAPGQETFEFSSLTFTLGTEVFNFGADIFNAVTIVDDNDLGDSVTVDASNLDFDTLFIFGIADFFNPDVFTGTNLTNVTNIGSLDQFSSSFTTASGEFIELSNIQASSVSAIPEPATWLMMIFGFGIVGLARKSRVKTATTTA